VSNTSIWGHAKLADTDLGYKRDWSIQQRGICESALEFLES